MKKVLTILLGFILTANLFAQKNEYGSLEYEYDFKLDTFLKSISNDFHYEFPKIINLDHVRKVTYDVSKFSKEEKQFYDDYVGCYFRKDSLTKEFLSEHLSEVSVNHIENDIVFWGFFKSKCGINYNTKDNHFYEYDSHSAMKIKNILNYRTSLFENRYIKLRDFNIVNEVIESKKQKMNRPRLNNVEENKIREILTGFYTLLGQKKFNEIIDTYFDSKIDREKYVNMLFGNYTILSDMTAPFDIYINTFFNSDIDKYDADTIFVELMHSDPLNYVSFAIKKINGEYKIVQYVGKYDEE